MVIFPHQKIDSILRKVAKKALNLENYKQKSKICVNNYQNSNSTKTQIPT